MTVPRPPELGEPLFAIVSAAPVTLAWAVSVAGFDNQEPSSTTLFVNVFFTPLEVRIGVPAVAVVSVVASERFTPPLFVPK